MSSSFQDFRTYAGTIKRKEGFFTYYLTNALDYIDRNYPSLFSAVKDEHSSRLFDGADLLSSGVRVERTYSARTSAMRIYLDDALLDQIGLLVDWVNEILTRGTKNGTLKIPNESLRVTTVVQDRLQEQARSAKVGRLGQWLKNVNVDQGVTAEVRARVEALKAAIESSDRGSLRSAVVDEFISTVPDETSRRLLSRFIQGIGLKENPYLVVVSDATQAITALGIHVWCANSPKGKHFSFLTLRQNMIVIPLST